MLDWLGRKLFVLRYEFSGGGGGGQQSTTTTQVNYSPAEEADRQKIRAEAESIYQGTPVSAVYPGAGVAGFDPNTLAAQQYIQRAATGPLIQTAGDINNAVSFGLKDLIYGQDPTLDRAITSAVRPIYQSYTDPGGYFSQLRTEMGQNNTVGGSRDQIGRAILGGRFAQAAGDTAAKLAQQSRGDTLDAFTRTLAFSPQAMQATLQPAVALSAVGEQNQAQQQAELDFATQQNYWDMNYPWQRLQNFANIIYGGQNPGTTTTATGAMPRSNPVTGALGGAAAGMSLAGPYGALAGAVLGLLGSR